MIAHSTDHAAFTIERRLDAPVDAVWRALTTVEGKQPWFAEGEGWTIEEFTMDVRPGGREYCAFRYQGGDIEFNETFYLDVVENVRLVFAYAMVTGGKRISASLATVELAPEGAGTTLVFTEQAAFLDGGDRVESREGGWRALLDALARVAAASRAAA